MLEESSMEKKNANRSAAGPSKTSGTDAKSKQDVVVKKYPRSGRRRESPCPRPEPARKPLPQRSKMGFDKRPKPREFCSNDRDRSDIGDASNVEVGSALQKGSKKLNLNHLLNFSYTPRETNSHVSYWGNSWKSRNGWSTKKHKYNKEQFLQANCQFVVKAGGNYAVHAVDPDPLVDWEAIEMVCIPSHDIASCPICLCEPVAAKITRCGHIYCWACILHYLALTDKSWRKCPICFEAVHKKDLKSVNVVSTRNFIVGETITMRLMQRVKGSVFAMVKSQWKDRRGEFLHLDEGDEEKCFSKLLIASPKQVRDLVIAKERATLERQLEEDKDCPEACFIESALQLLSEREQQLMRESLLVSAVEGTSSHTTTDVASGKVQLSEGSKRIVYLSAFDDEIDNNNHIEREVITENRTEIANDNELDQEKNDEKRQSVINTCRKRYESTSTDSTCGEITVDDLDLSSVSVEEHAEETNSKDVYYFYQAADGQHAYMHALNIRMLVKEYGSLDKCPDTVTGKIIEKEGISMTEQLRKRLRYLRHLPLTCEFEVIELNLMPPIVSQKTIRSFEEEIEKRRRRRNKRARDEKRRERYIQEEEKRKYGIYPGAHLNLSSHHQFPRCKNEESNEIHSSVSSAIMCFETPPMNSSPLLSSEALGETASTPLSSSVEEGSSSVPSFAQMLRDGKARANKMLSHPSTHSSSGNNGNVLEKTRTGEDSEPEDYVPAPEYHLSFGDAIQEALKKASGSNAVDPSDQGINKKKKKKNKTTLLFTTNMARSNK
uniref:E3 ubiquitin-protein ligase RNF10 n=1 Tax=Hemiscolopendra marginata TaxID=943146 RepID=A0A646QJC5_9MYRI